MVPILGADRLTANDRFLTAGRKRYAYTSVDVASAMQGAACRSSARYLRTSAESIASWFVTTANSCSMVEHCAKSWSTPAALRVRSVVIAYALQRLRRAFRAILGVRISRRRAGELDESVMMTIV
jgi:hypothetical protein